MRYGINEARIEKEDATGRVERSRTHLCKIDRTFTSLFRLLKEIEEIPGCHGLLVDLVDCNEQARYAIDIAAKHQLFSLVVDNMKAA